MNGWKDGCTDRRKVGQKFRTLISQKFWNNNMIMLLCVKFHEDRTSTSLKTTLTKNLSKTDERTNRLENYMPLILHMPGHKKQIVFQYWQVNWMSVPSIVEFYEKSPVLQDQTCNQRINYISLVLAYTTCNLLLLQHLERLIDSHFKIIYYTMSHYRSI